MAASDDILLLQVPPRLKGSEAPALKSLLADHRGRPVALDFANVSQLGTQCLQVLLSAHATWSVEDTSFEIRNAPDTVRDGLMVCGIQPAQIGIKETHDDA